MTNTTPPDRSPGPLRLVARIVGIALAAILLAVAAALWWAGQTTSFVRWALARAVAASEGALQVGAVRGTLAGGVSLASLRWRDDAREIELRDLSLAWRPERLLQGELRLARVEIGSASVRLRGSGEPAALPGSLELPIDVRLDAVGVGRLEVAAQAAEPVVLERLALAGRYRGGAYRVEHLSAHSPAWGEAGIEGSLGARTPFPLELAGRLAPRIEGWGVLPEVRLLADGALEDFAVVAQALEPAGVAALADAQAPRPVWIGLDTRVRPLAASLAERLAPIALTLDGVEPGQLGIPDAPRARLSGTATLRVDDGRVSGKLELRNALPGPADRQAIPVSAIDTAFEWSDRRLALTDLRAALPGGGAVTGAVAVDLGRSTMVLGRSLPATAGRLALRDVDLSQLASRLQATRLRGEVAVDDAAFGLDLTDASRRDIAASARARIDGEALRIERARVGTPAGSVSASGTASLAAPWRIDLAGDFAELDPAGVAALRGVLGGVNVPELPAQWRERLAGSLTGSWAAQGTAWPDPLLRARITVDRGRLDGQPLRADLQGRVAVDRIADAALELSFGDLHASARGSLGQVGDRLRFSVRADRLARLDPRLAGSLAANGELSGGWSGWLGGPRSGAAAARNDRAAATAAGLGVVADLEGRQLRWEDSARVDALSARIELPDLRAGRLAVRAEARGLEVSGERLDRVRVDGRGDVDAHTLGIAVSGPRVAGRAAAHGGLVQGGPEGTWRWEGGIDELVVDAPLAVRLASRVSLVFDGHGVSLGEAALDVDGGVVRLGALNWRDGRFDARGEAGGLPVARWAERFAGPQALAGIEGQLEDVRLHGTWDLAGRSLQAPSGRLALRLDAGDAADNRGEARLTLDEGRLDGSVDVRIPTLAFANRLIGPEWAVAGRLRFAGSVGGTIAKPRLEGSLTGRNLVLVQRALGWRLGDGTLRAHFGGDRLDLETLRLESGGGAITMAGQLLLDGMQGGFTLRAERLPVPIGPGQRVILSGSTGVASSGTRFEWIGNIRADEGLIELRGGEAPSLPEDVVIVDRGAAAGALRTAGDAAAAREEAGFRIGADLNLDLGEKLRVRGSGVDVVLGGSLNLRGTLPAAPRAYGTVRVREGTYTAYGQRLEITRGQVVFNGPLDNPVLDIVAMRRDQAVEAGVALGGTVLSPRLRLVSTPEVPDSQKLSWLVLGVGLDDVGTAGQAAALQTAAATLFGSNDGGLSGGLTGALGLDMLTVRGAGAGGVFDPDFGAAFPGQATTGGAPVGAAAQNVVAIGKRLGSRVFLTYEQGLRGVWNLLRIQYDITNRLSVRAQAGTDSAVDVLYFWSFD